MIRLPSAEDPEVSVIVLLDGAAEMAERGLRAIAETGDAVPCETVVVLNDPDPELEDLVRKSTTGGRVVLCRANAGPGVAWNLGTAVARAPRLASLHEDSEPEPGWLGPLCETMTETGAGAVGSRLFNGDGSVQNCGWVLFSDASHQPLNATTAPEVAAATEPTPADMLSGAAMMVDREAVRAVGGWDERFHPAVFVDIDVSTAIWHLGRPVLSVPTSRVRHQSGTFDSRPSSALTGRWLRLFLLERNRGPFIAKWESVPDLAPPPSDPRPETRRAAVAAALSHTRERAEGVRAGTWPGPGRARLAEARYTGLADPPVVEGDGVFTVSPAVTEGLKRAEANLVDEYCSWLIRKEEENAQQLQDLLEESRRNLTQQHEHIENLQRSHAEVARALNEIVTGRTWRMRNRVVNLLRGPKRARQDSNL